MQFSYRGNTAIYIGLFGILIDLILILFIFGVTFGTLFLGGIGLVLISIGILSRLKRVERLKKKVAIVQRVFFFMFILWFISFIIVEGLILTSIKPQENIDEIDCLLILGAGLRGDKPSLILSTRLNKSLEYIEQYPDTPIIVSGGQGPGETITEAEAMKKFLVNNGVGENIIIKEEESTSTKENLIFSKSILDSIEGKKKHKVLIVTNNFHMFRAKYLAKKYNLVPYGAPVETPTFVLLNYLVREYFAVIKSFIFD